MRQSLSIFARLSQVTFRCRLGKYVATSSVFEVERGVESNDVNKIKAGHPVSLSQSNLSRRRYAQNDDTLYVAPEDERTDYVCSNSSFVAPISPLPFLPRSPNPRWQTGTRAYSTRARDVMVIQPSTGCCRNRGFL